MHIVMKKEFNSYSVANRNLQRQFFRALVVQTIVPTILFACPALSVLLTPLLDIKMNYETGWIYAAFSLYPTIDSIAFMLLVSEYLSDLFKQIFPDKSSRKSETYSATT
nr:hypothetical protein C34D4.6 - Caenorhabditis elegans [Caenorhabditis elegans]